MVSALLSKWRSQLSKQTGSAFHTKRNIGKRAPINPSIGGCGGNAVEQNGRSGIVAGCKREGLLAMEENEMLDRGILYVTTGGTDGAGGSLRPAGVFVRSCKY